MSRFIENRVWGDLCPEKSNVQWLIKKILRLVDPPKLPANTLVYEAIHSIQPRSNRYVNSFNSARIELVTTLVTPPITMANVKIDVDYYPRGEPAYWLMTHVFGFTADEIRFLSGSPEPQEISPEILIFMRKIYRVCQRNTPIADPLVASFQHSRYLVLRYFLDAEYHLIN